MRSLVLLLAACSGPDTKPPPIAAHVPRDAAPPAEPLRWLAGDLHMHVSPPDHPDDVELSASAIAAAAQDAHMDFVVLTPHVWPSRWGVAFRRQWHELAADARAQTGVTLIPGIEWTSPQGHFTVTGVDVVKLGDDLLASAHQAGAFVSVNHPFAVPTRLPGIPASHYDMSYRVWTDHARGFTAIDGVEVWNVPLSFANVLSRPGGATGEQRAWLSANAVVHAEHRKLTAVGGTDNHHRAVAATTWVLAPDASEAAILGALRAGRTCVGSPAGGSFRARGDDGSWVRIGGAVRAAGTVALAWDGTARLYVDGVDAGEHTGGFEHQAGGELHTYRIETGASRCGFIYANL
jgi:predicted metal-dependent phosphoesterase TrpH